MTQQEVAHLDAKKVLTMLAQPEVPVLGGVENIAAFHCLAAVPRSNSSRRRRSNARSGQPVSLGSVPSHSWHSSLIVLVTPLVAIALGRR